MKDPFSIFIYVTSALSVFTSGVFGAFGAVVHYLYLIVKGEHVYESKALLIYAFLGFFVGFIAEQMMLSLLGKVLPGVILICGFLTIKILDFLNANGLRILIKKAGVDTQVEEPEK